MRWESCKNFRIEGKYKKNQIPGLQKKQKFVVKFFLVNIEKSQSVEEIFTLVYTFRDQMCFVNHQKNNIIQYKIIKNEKRKKSENQDQYTKNFKVYTWKTNDKIT